MSSEKPLTLNPGAPPRRKSITGCKCLLLTAAILFPISVVLFLANIAHGLLKYGSNPHRALYQNATLAEVKNRGSVVQPLISKEQTFDIAATVWLRSAEGIGHAAFVPDKKTGKDKDNTTADGDVGAPSEGDVQEIPLFSDIVFRGVRLTDKNVFATINYKLPTAVFRETDLSNYDVRGSFMLIPSSPSLLDHVTDYTTWIPDTVRPFLVRSWPFPLGSSRRSDKTLVDEAIETFGVSVPLVRFHDIKSRCPKTDEAGKKTLSETHAITGGAAVISATADMEDDSDDADEFDDEKGDRVGEDSKSFINKMSRKTILYTTKDKPILENHPYVVTRTQIRVVDETNLFNRKAYLKAHKQLKKSSCGQGVLGVNPSRYRCDPEYRVNGHWGTQLKLEIWNDATGEVQTEWAYAPYMAATKQSLGPKDIRPVPVYREKCKEYQTETLSGLFKEQDFMDVTWKVSYSGRTPLKHGVLEWNDLFFPKKLNMSESEHLQVLKQDSAELYSGVAGHQFEEGIQPRRRAILRGIGHILSIIISILDIRYWYTRTSTVSISILGGALRASSYIIYSVGAAIKYGKAKDLSVVGWISWCLYLGVASLTLPMLMIKVIARIEFGWWRGTSWIPIMQIVGATHRERASERLEAKTPLRLKISLFLLITAIYYILAPHDHHVIAALLPPPSPGDLKKNRFDELAPFILQPIYLTGRVLQLLLNRRSKTYASSHRIATVLALVQLLTELAEFVPALVGRFDARRSFSIQDVVDSAVVVVGCWQAITLPSVPQASDDEHIE